MTRLPWAVLLLTVLGARYLSWRLNASLNLATPLSTTVSLLTLAAELVLLAGFFLQLWFTLLPARPAPAAGPIPMPAPAVDVLVPTCGEPAELVERCLRGCLAMDYPALTVWLLDDAGRPELAELCDRLGCRYLARVDHAHAKAGNLNHGLRHCQGDLVAVFDADVVPLRPFLSRTVGLFTDPSVGFVQTPQSYMNADPVMRNLRLERWLLPDEESFYRWIQPTRQNLNAVVCAGTSFVMRRHALERVGASKRPLPRRISPPVSGSRPRATATTTSRRSSAPAWPRSRRRPWPGNAAAGAAVRCRPCARAPTRCGSPGSVHCNGWPTARASCTGSVSRPSW